MNKKKLAAQLYTVRDFTKSAEGLAESLRKIAAIGYSAVQVSGIGKIPHDLVKKMADDNGLTICNTHVGFAGLQNDLDAIIEQHRLWECRHVAVGSMPKEYRSMGEDGYYRFSAEANIVGEKLHAAGMTFSYHNHSLEMARYGNQTGLDIIFNETDPRFLQAEIDTYWIQHGGGDPVAWIKRMHNRQPVIHLKDMVIADGENLVGEQLMAEVGYGNMDWEAILAACEETNVEWYAVELDNSQRDPFDSLAMSYQFLNKMGLK